MWCPKRTGGQLLPVLLLSLKIELTYNIIMNKQMFRDLSMWLYDLSMEEEDLDTGCYLHCLSSHINVHFINYTTEQA